jgi:hypothetical protein
MNIFMKPLLLILWFAPLFAFAQPILPFPGGSPFPVPGFPPTTLPVPQTAPLIYYTQDTFNSYTVTEKPLFYINDTLTIKADDPNLSVYAQPAGTYTSSFTKGDLYIDGDKDNPMYDGTLTLVGTLVRNGTSQYDLQIVIKRNNTLISGPRINGIPQQSLARGTEIPVVFDPMTDLHVTDELYILNMRTNSVLFGPMEVGRVGKYESANLYANHYYYITKFSPRTTSKLYPTLAECNAARAIEMGSPNPCYATYRKNLSIWWAIGDDSTNPNLSSVSGATARMVFVVDTKGLNQEFALLYRKANTNDPLVHATPNVTIQTAHGTNKNIAFNLSNLEPDKSYTFWLIDGFGYNHSDTEQNTNTGSVDLDKESFERSIQNRFVFFTNTFTAWSTPPFNNTQPDVSRLLVNPINLNANLAEPTGSLVPCGIDGTRGFPKDGVLSKGDVFFDADKNGEISAFDPAGVETGDTVKGDLNNNGTIDLDPASGEWVDDNGEPGLQVQEWRNTNGIPGFQPMGELCEYNDGIELLRRILRYVNVIIPTIAAIMLAYSGYLFLTSNENPERRSLAKKSVKWVIIGILIVLGAWLIVANVMSLIGFNGEWSWLKLN